MPFWKRPFPDSSRGISEVSVPPTDVGHPGQEVKDVGDEEPIHTAIGGQLTPDTLLSGSKILPSGVGSACSVLSQPRSVL